MADTVGTNEHETSKMRAPATRSGGRSVTLWSLTHFKRLPRDHLPRYRARGGRVTGRRRCSIGSFRDGDDWRKQCERQIRLKQGEATRVSAMAGLFMAAPERQGGIHNSPPVCSSQPLPNLHFLAEPLSRLHKLHQGDKKKGRLWRSRTPDVKAERRHFLTQMRADENCGGRKRGR